MLEELVIKLGGNKKDFQQLVECSILDDSLILEDFADYLDIFGIKLSKLSIDKTKKTRAYTIGESEFGLDINPRGLTNEEFRNILMHELGHLICYDKIENKADLEEYCDWIVEQAKGRRFRDLDFSDKFISASEYVAECFTDKEFDFDIITTLGESKLEDFEKLKELK